MMRRVDRNRRASSLGQAASGFVPTQITSLMLWLRGDKGISIGTGVSAWADQSGHGNDVVQATGALQPAYQSASAINGLPAVAGNGTTQYLQTAGALSATPGTVFVVLKANSSGSYAAISDVTGTYHVLYSVGAAMEFFSGSGNLQQNVAYTNPHVYAATITGTAASAFYVDGVGVTGTLTETVGVGLQVCGDLSATEFWPGPIAEVLMFSAVLSPSDLSRVGQYLAARYNIAGTW